jgi:3D (Asp-Asp-Asp) domain-containing protein
MERGILLLLLSAVVCISFDTSYKQGLQMERLEQDKIDLQQSIDSLTTTTDCPMKFVGCVEVTAYCSYRRETDATPFLCEGSGWLLDTVRDYRKVIACNFLPLFTNIFIEDVGWCLVVDRTHEKNNKKIDLYYGRNRKEAIQWGIQKKKVFKEER